MKPGEYVLSEAQQATICNMYQSGDSARSIACEMDTCYQMVYKVLKRRGIVVNHPRPTKEATEKVKSLYLGGSSLNQIAPMFNTGYTTIRRILEKAGIPRRRRVYTANDAAFSEISPESAYWIGFLMADGCIQHPEWGMPTVKLSLQIRDKDHLEKFKRFLKATYPIHDIKAGMQSVLQIGSSEIASDLSKYGVVPRKAANAKVIGLEDDRDFWRGEVDGDGCLGVLGPRRIPYLELAGSKWMMEQFKAFVQKIVPQNRTNVLKRPGSTCTLRVNNSRAVEVIRVLYADCSVALDRKYQRAQELMRQK